MDTDLLQANNVFDQSASKRLKRFYFVKCWDNADPDEIDSKIDSAEMLVERFDQVRNQIYENKDKNVAHWRRLNKQVQSLRRRDELIGRSMNWKTEKLDHLQSELDKLQNPKDSYQRRGIGSRTSVEHKIYTLHFWMLHGHNNLATEKKFLREIGRIKSKQSDANSSSSLLKELNSQCWMDWSLYYKSNNEAKYRHIVEEMKQVKERKQKGMVDAAAKGKTWNPMSSKRAKQYQIKLLNELWEELRKERSEVTAEIGCLEEGMKNLVKDIRILRKQLREINRKKEETQECILNLRSQKNYHMKARELAKKKDVAALDALSRSQVDEFMSRWNNSRTLRSCYEKGILQSLEKRRLCRDRRRRNGD